MRKLALFAVVAGLVLSAHAIASANIIFADNFNSENNGAYALNYNNFINWVVTNGTVDLIGVNSPWDLHPGNGLYVDLDGSTNDAGLFATRNALALNPGLYELSFYLGGSKRGSTETVTVQSNVGSYSQNFILASNQPLTRYSHTFYLASPMNVTLSFQNLGGDDIGAILDNVQLAAIPEPASMLLLGIGLFGLGVLKKKR